MDILAKAFELTVNNKEFGALVGILIYSMKQHSATKVQQATCNGKFELQGMVNSNTEKKTEEIEVKVDSAVEISAEAEKTANKAYRCVKQINTKVDGLVKTVEEATTEYKKYIDDKHSETLTKQD